MTDPSPELDLDLEGYDLTIVPDEQLCQLCLAQVVKERARIEMALEPNEIRLCLGCKAKEHAIQRERMSFPEAAEGWLSMVRDIEGMKNSDGYIPVRILLPNGTALNSKAQISVKADEYSTYELRTLGSRAPRQLRGMSDQRMVELRLPEKIIFRDFTERSILQPGSFEDLEVYGG